MFKAIYCTLGPGLGDVDVEGRALFAMLAMDPWALIWRWTHTPRVDTHWAPLLGVSRFDLLASLFGFVCTVLTVVQPCSTFEILSAHVAQALPVKVAIVTACQSWILIASRDPQPWKTIPKKVPISGFGGDVSLWLWARH